jgi:hypothetical protein
MRQQLGVAESVDTLKRKRDRIASLGPLDDSELVSRRAQCASAHVDVHACPACDVFLELSEHGELVRSAHTSKKRKVQGILDEIQDVDRAIEAVRRRVALVENIDAELEELARASGGSDVEETRSEIARVSEYISVNVKRESTLAERRRTEIKNQAVQAAVTERMASIVLLVQAARESITRTHPTATNDAQRFDVARVAKEFLENSRMVTEQIANSEKRVKDAERALAQSRLWAERAKARAREGGIPSEADVCAKREAVERTLEVCTELEGSILSLEAEQERRLHVSKRLKWVAEKTAARVALDDAVNCEFGTAMFAKHIPECQALCMASVIDTLNQHIDSLGSYLFDGEEDTCISIETSRVTKNAGFKTEVHLRVTRGGIDFPCKSLSGGETARLNACFTFALNAMFSAQSSVILLDELTASLDQVSAEAVISRARIMFPDKLVVFISHQVVTGLFDRVVCLDGPEG